MSTEEIALARRAAEIDRAQMAQMRERQDKFEGRLVLLENEATANRRRFAALEHTIGANIPSDDADGDHQHLHRHYDSFSQRSQSH